MRVQGKRPGVRSPDQDGESIHLGAKKEAPSQAYQRSARHIFHVLVLGAITLPDDQKARSGVGRPQQATRQVLTKFTRYLGPFLRPASPSSTKPGV